MIHDDTEQFIQLHTMVDCVNAYTNRNLLLLNLVKTELLMMDYIVYTV